MKENKMDQLYKTKQRQIILDCLMLTSKEHVTVQDIKEYLKEEALQVSTATIYRCLDKFIREGVVSKYYIDGNLSACFQYKQTNREHESHIHFKCTKCGNLSCVECDKFDELKKHFSNEHGLRVDSMKTVFYGLCEKCSEK